MVSIKSFQKFGEEKIDFDDKTSKKNVGVGDWALPKYPHFSAMKIIKKHTSKISFLSKAEFNMTIVIFIKL